MQRVRFLPALLTGLSLLAACGGDRRGESQPPPAGGSQSSTQAPPVSGNQVWMDYESGLARAGAEGKFLLIDFWTSWCHWCKVMDKETYTDPEVRRRLGERFVTVKVDAESNEAQGKQPGAPTGRALAALYGVNSYPTTWFVDSQGQKIAPLPGYVEPKQFARVLEYITSEAYRKQSFQDYMNERQGS